MTTPHAQHLADIFEVALEVLDAVQQRGDESLRDEAAQALPPLRAAYDALRTEAAVQLTHQGGLLLLAGIQASIGVMHRQHPELAVLPARIRTEDVH